MSTKESVPAVFFFSNQISDDLNGLDVCKACQRVAGPRTIVGAQKLQGLYRIYPASNSARDILLVKGVSIDGNHIPILGTNPRVVDTQDTVKVIIGKVPLSVSNDEIMAALESVDGLVPRSQLKEEFYREKDGRLTAFKSGRRFIYVDTPSRPLPRTLQVSIWRASLYHRGQREENTQLEPFTSAPLDSAWGVGAGVRPSGVIAEASASALIGDRCPVVGGAYALNQCAQVQEGPSSMTEVPASGGCVGVDTPVHPVDLESGEAPKKSAPIDLKQYFKSPAATHSGKKTSPRGRPPSRQQKSRSKSVSLVRKRHHSSEQEGSPARRNRVEGATAVETDYFLFDNSSIK